MRSLSFRISVSLLSSPLPCNTLSAMLSSIHASLETPISPHGHFLAALTGLFLVFALVRILSMPEHRHTKDDGDKTMLPMSSLTTPWPFFHQRFDFLNAGFRSTGQSIFKFNLFQHMVVAISGETGREAFLKLKAFNINEGFYMLSGALPILRGVTTEFPGRTASIIYKRLGAVQREGSLGRIIPQILADAKHIIGTWGESGTMDPFVQVYELMFQITLRALTCREIADDPAVAADIRRQYQTLEKVTTPASVLLPWFPSWAMVKKWMATVKIYYIIIQALNKRERSNVPQDDTLQMFLDLKDDKLTFIGFCMGFIISGARSTGCSTIWLLIYLGINPEWKTKAIAEIEKLLLEHSMPTGSLSDRLASIPLDAWESQMPIFDAFIRETLRIAQPHTAMRRNTGPDVYIEHQLVPSGSFVVYPFSDIHLNPEYYPDPWKFDPTRNHDEKVWIGWGRGSVTCLGTRLAKVQMKVITSLIMLAYHFTVVDESGATPTTSLHPDWNDHLGARAKNNLYLKFQKKDISL